MHNNAEGINFKMTTIGAEDRPQCNLRPWTLEKMVRWINNSKDLEGIEESVKKELCRSAAQYPEQALPKWKKNFPLHLAKAKKKIRNATPLETKELGDDETSENEDFG